MGKNGSGRDMAHVLGLGGEQAPRGKAAASCCTPQGGCCPRRFVLSRPSCRCGVRKLAHVGFWVVVRLWARTEVVAIWPTSSGWAGSKLPGEKQQQAAALHRVGVAHVGSFCHAPRVAVECVSLLTSDFGCWGVHGQERKWPRYGPRPRAGWGASSPGKSSSKLLHSTGWALLTPVRFTMLLVSLWSA